MLADLARCYRFHIHLGSSLWSCVYVDKHNQHYNCCFDQGLIAIYSQHDCFLLWIFHLIARKAGQTCGTRVEPGIFPELDTHFIVWMTYVDRPSPREFKFDQKAQMVEKQIKYVKFFKFNTNEDKCTVNIKIICSQCLHTHFMCYLANANTFQLFIILITYSKWNEIFWH